MMLPEEKIVEKIPFRTLLDFDDLLTYIFSTSSSHLSSLKLSDSQARDERISRKNYEPQ